MSAGLAVAVAGALIASAYPASLDAPTLTAWLRQTNDIAPEQVVAVSPSAATAILDQIPPTRGRAEVRLRALALTPQSTNRSGVAAWEMQLQVECRTGDVRLGATTGYPSRESRDGEVTLSAGADNWRKPQPGTVLESAWRAVCDPKFRPPLAATLRVAQAPAAARPAQTTKATKPAAPRRTAPSAAVASRDAVAKEPARSAPARGGKAAVQVVSSPNEAETRATLTRFQRRYGLGGYQTRIEPAKVGGRTTYRGLIAGFATRSDAQGFCRSLAKRGQSCLTR